MKFIKNKIFWYYFLLIAGGLWNYLGLFSDIMELSSGFVMIIICLIAITEVNVSDKIKLYFISTFIFITSMIFEYIGLNTGYLFGNYSYSTLLKPQVLGLPLAIGSAWLSTFLISTTIISSRKSLVFIIFGSLLMTTFDFFLEPAAIKLNYWTWEGVSIPTSNYITWFTISLLYFTIQYFLKLRITNKGLKHLYLAQVLYFLLSTF
ncbi:carotenoid biosynthesis protein [Candidatus Kapabacteria bacterium]|nr:carotenoid biosynthesis protein [Candidatus Kapabacteria bacterium]